MLYNQLVTDHTDAFSKMPHIVSEELVDNALRYFESKTFPLIYPAKAYSVAIIYATLIEKVYGFPVRESLDDPDLFLGQDPYFKRYSEDPDTYEQILTKLEGMANWIESGWSPQTVEYFYAECTEEGIERVTEALYS